ncbi:hypothetical protein GWI33_000001 [Rhynchophorus ferrugineus]|uniref:Uncharacterized protein n=1 Tax=Rhynchophorus ferrugineus TaxID=354439 RepID=A0A834J0I5_RHYFE|nr:hypothetical protein GWI33_000001 [Rhynchophorus ferrugineus]
MKSILLLALLSVLQSATNPLPMKKDQQTAGTDDLKASPSSSIHYTVGASLSNSNFDQAKSPLRSTGVNTVGGKAPSISHRFSVADISIQYPIYPIGISEGFEGFPPLNEIEGKIKYGNGVGERERTIALNASNKHHSRSLT